jgi:hypothetical protein
MGDKKDLDRNDDGVHDFEAGTASARGDEIVDDEGHAFTRGRVADHDEVDES